MADAPDNPAPVEWQPPLVPNPRPVVWPPVPFPDHAIHHALRNQAVWVWNQQGTERTRGRVYLHRNADDVERAYQLIGSKSPMELMGGNGVVRGWILHARILQRVPNAETQLKTFRKTPDKVIIKQLIRNVIDPCLNLGGAENPYKEIAVMQHYGDGIHGTHIIQCVEALRDNGHLYIITPYHPHGDLHANIHWGTGGFRRVAPTRAGMQTLVENILYIQHPHRRLIHRDLSPENVMVDRDHAVFPMIDFAMSLRYPIFENRGGDIPADQRCGKPPYMPPEVAYPPSFGSQIGEPVNVWILGVIFFNILTGARLYEVPGDIFFEHLVYFGLTNDEINQVYLDQLEEGDRMHSHILRIQRLHPDAKDLLDRMMKWLPEDRIRPNEILEHRWFTAGGGE